MEQYLSKKYQEFLEAPGDPLTKLRLVGYPVGSLSGIQINTLEDFKRVVSGIDSLNSEDLKRELKKIHKNYMSLEVLRSFLKTGSESLDDQELADALRILPLDEDSGILIDDMVDYLYK